MAKIIGGVTEKGFTFNIEQDNLDDIELVEILAEIEKGRFTKFPLFVEKVLGKKQKEKLYDYYRDEKGRVSLATIMKVVMEEMMQSSTETKN